MDENINDWISKKITSSDVVLFMKGTPEAPQCGFSSQVVQILNYLDTAGDTNSRYYNFGIAHTSGATRTLYLNKGIYGSNNFFDPRCVSTITVMEIEA